MNDLNELKPIQALSPFKRFCCTIGNLPSSYVESMSYMELVYWLCDYLQNTVIPAVNNNANAVLELQNLYVELKNYVDNYFENIDIQEEINNRLDEMAESGELDTVIENYVDYCYIIKEIEKIDIYNENGKTNVTIFHIPNKDLKGNNINLKHGFSNDVIHDTEASETPTEFSKRKNATLTTNASIASVETTSPNYNKILGLIIHDGQVVTDTREFYPVPGIGWQGRYILGLKNNGLLQSYIGNSNAQDLINDGVVESFQGFMPLLIDGNNTRSSLLNTTLWSEPTFEETGDETPIKNKVYFIIQNGKYVAVYNIPNFSSGVTYYEQTNNDRYPRQIIAQNTVSKDFYILSCSGKGKETNEGLTLEEAIGYLLNMGCSFAYLLDQGGSVSTAYRNIEQIPATDNPNFVTQNTNGLGLTERKVADFIYFSKEINSEKDDSLNYIYAEINRLQKKINDLIINLKESNILNEKQGNSAKVINYTDNYFPSLAFGNFNKETFENDLITSITTNDENINFYDVENSKSVFRILKEGGILIPRGNSLEKLASIFEDTFTVTDLDSIDKNSFNVALGSANNAPFNDTTWRGNMVITIVSKTAQSSEIRCQIAFYIGTNPTQIAYRSYASSTWTDWKFINFS